MIVEIQSSGAHQIRDPDPNGAQLVHIWILNWSGQLIPNNNNNKKKMLQNGDVAVKFPLRKCNSFRRDY